MRQQERALGLQAIHSDIGCDAPKTLQKILERADVRINGNRPWDIKINNPRVYRRVFLSWSLGFGEAYVDGDWDCDRLDELMARLIKSKIESSAVGWAKLQLLWEYLRHRFLNLQSRSRAFDVGKRHYDVGNDVFQAMLDSRMIYSCGYWERAADLEQAQLDKLDMVCRKLQLREGESLLDIGCGWGGLAKFAAERYGVKVTGVTVSKEQLAVARESCAGLPVKLSLRDYRDLKGKFDKIVSVGMFEHVGPKNYQTYFSTVLDLLAPGGAFLLHSIGLPSAGSKTDPWIDKYVFPNGKIPSVREIAAAVEKRFIIEDWHNFGQDYDRTLMAWWKKFDRAWPRLRERYDQKFYRMWKYYLLCCAGFFRSRQGQLWQVVLTRAERANIYRSTRHAAPVPSQQP